MGLARSRRAEENDVAMVSDIPAFREPAERLLGHAFLKCEIEFDEGFAEGEAGEPEKLRTVVLFATALSANPNLKSSAASLLVSSPCLMESPLTNSWTVEGST